MATTNYYEQMLKKMAQENASPTTSQSGQAGTGGLYDAAQTGGQIGDVYSRAADQMDYGGSATGAQSGQEIAPIGNTANVTLVGDAGQRQTGVADTSEPGYFDSMRNYYEEMYNSQVEANNRALENARAQAQAAADARRKALAQEYQGLDRQLYRDYMGNKRTLPQELAAQGYTGGITESSRLRLTNAYEEALAENERARLSQEAGADQDLKEQLYNAQAAADAANQQAARDRYSYLAALEEAEYQQEQERLKDRAAMLATAGDFSGYLQLGYSQTEVDSMTRAWLAQNPGMLEAWIRSHPADAKRMGISMPAAAPVYSSSGRRYGGSSGGSGSGTGDSPTMDALAAAARSTAAGLMNSVQEAVQQAAKKAAGSVSGSLKDRSGNAWTRYANEYAAAAARNAGIYK